MNAQEFSSMLNGRKIGKNRFVAKCPSHSDRHPSLSIAEGRTGVLIRCMSQGCETRDVLKAMGLTWSALFYEDRNRPDPEIIRQIHAQRELEEQLQRDRKQIAYAALKQAQNWDKAAHELARLLARFPDDDSTAVLYHRALLYMRRCEGIAEAYWPTTEAWLKSSQTTANPLWGIRPEARYEWPTKLTVADVGPEVAGKLGLYDHG